MAFIRQTRRTIGIIAVAALVAGPVLSAQQAAAPAQGNPTFVPTVGQAGKDVVWVPTPEPMVEKMLDLAKVTPQDFVMDLGSGDGRNVIAAAKRGARGVGVEYNPDMVALSNRLAKEAGVADKATFVQGDMYEADISKASVMALFLLPSNMLKLRDKFADLRPGSRIVSNTFTIEDWTPEEEVTIEGDCTSWCRAMLYIVPAKVAGTWRTGDGELAISQTFQTVTAVLKNGTSSTELRGKMVGEEIRLNGGGRELVGRVNGNRIEGKGWSATKAGS
jgi:SAM-dependent methyltransferase